MILGVDSFLGSVTSFVGFFYDEMAVHRHIHCLMQNAVDSPHRGTRQRTAIGPALLFQLSSPVVTLRISLSPR